MNFAGKKFVASYSGGKDSALAVYRAKAMGMEPIGLITTYNTDLERSWFHGIPEDLLRDVGDALGIPASLIRTSGADYESSFIRELLRQKELGAEVCVFGDIDIEGHLEWCSNVCAKAGIIPCFPLWKESRAALVEESIGLGFVDNITVVDTARLSADHLGKVLSREVAESIRVQGADVCGENGEYHTFVSDGPIFAHPVAFRCGQMQLRGQYAVLPLKKP